MQREYVSVKGDSGAVGVHRSASLAGDVTLRFTATSSINDSIQDLKSNGFEVGTDNTVNASGTTYYWVAFNAGNNSPVAVDNLYVTNEDGTLNMYAPGVLSNDNDADDLQSTLTAIKVTDPAHMPGFVLNPDGSFSYTPDANVNGTDS